MAELTGPLCGLKVLDIGTMIAGPFCGTLLADFGADVLKVEHPEHGDPMRAWTPMVDGLSLWWKMTARNKRMITLNLSKPDGQAILKDLVRTADIVVENYRPGTLERWGLGYDALEQINPGLVLVRISGYGQNGPYRNRPGYGTCAEAMSGIPAFTGFPDKPPQLSAFPLADYLAGTFGAMSAMFAIYHRDRSGHGQSIDVSLFEPLFRLVEAQVIGYDKLHLVKKRVGNRLEEDAPRNAYETSDGKYVTISASSPRTWERFTQAIGRPELATDPRFKDNASRCASVEALDAIVAPWHKERTLDGILQIFAQYDVVAGPIYDIEQIFADAHYQVREAIVQVADPDLGQVKMQNVHPKFSRTPGKVRHPGLAKGFHNDTVYLQELNLAADRYATLRRDGII